MRKSNLISGVIVLAAGTTASAAYLDGFVQTGIWLGNRNAPSFAADVDDFRATHSETIADAQPNMMLTTPLPGALGAISPNAQVTITVTELDADTRQVDIVWATINNAPFVDVGTTADNGQVATDLIFTFGMSNLGGFPGATTNFFEDPDFVEVISSTGVLFNDSGAEVEPDAPLFLEEVANQGFSGRLFYQRRSSGVPNLNDVTERRISRYEATIIYTVPAPGAMALLGLSGLAVARRRRA